MKTKLFTIFLLIYLACCANAQANIPKKASLVVDLSNGRILHSENKHAVRYPASLVKMMTLYITFKEITYGKLQLNKKLKVSKKAASMPRTNLALKPGSKITVREAILGMIVHSSNDAAVVLAEAIGGSEANFVAMMNKQAKKLGMKNTTFRNASGWPHKQQKSTAYDLARLAIALKKNFPKFFSWFAITKFTLNGKTYTSHNQVVRNYEWATGLKTGFTCASGFNIATTASKDGKHLVGIVLGGETSKERDKNIIKLLTKGFKKAQSSKIKSKAVSSKSISKKTKLVTKAKTSSSISKAAPQKTKSKAISVKPVLKKAKIVTKIKNSASSAKSAPQKINPKTISSKSISKKAKLVTKAKNSASSSKSAPQKIKSKTISAKLALKKAKLVTKAKTSSSNSQSAPQKTKSRTVAPISKSIS